MVEPAAALIPDPLRETTPKPTQKSIERGKSEEVLFGRVVVHGPLVCQTRKIGRGLFFPFFQSLTLHLSFDYANF